MPVPDFSPGEVLTAAAMDSIGLWLVKTQAVGTGVTTINVPNAFSSDYMNYKIMWVNGTTSAATQITLQLGSSITGYYGGIPRVDASGANSPIGMNNTANWTFAGVGTGDGVLVDVELYRPNQIAFTTSKLSWFDNRTNNAWGVGGGVHRVAAAYSDFTLGFAVGVTGSGGTIRVYGYRN
jgi:hypothetical protein